MNIPIKQIIGFHKAAFLFVSLVAVATLVRFYKIDEVPRDFWTVRQYFVPLLARAMYIEKQADAPEWQKELASIHAVAFSGRELPILETVGVCLYQLTGRVSFWALRVQTVVAWIIGGLFLYSLVRHLLSPIAALAASLFYLFLPYGFVASRSLQPDALMIMGLLASFWTIVRYDENPSWGWWLKCAVVSGLGILIKPGLSQFAISAVYLFLSLNRQGIRGTLSDKRNYLFFPLAALPSAIYLTWQSLYGSSLSVFLDWNFAPNLYLTVYFWKGWAGILVHIFGFLPLILGVWGLLSIPAGRARAFAWGFGAGYVAQCLFTAVATASHDYWHLQVVPLIALGIGRVVEFIYRLDVGRFAITNRRMLPVMVMIAWMLSGDVWGPIRDIHHAHTDDYVRMAKEIGEAVGHSTRTIILDYDMGYPLMYLGSLYGKAWPESAYMEFHRRLPKPDPTADVNVSAADRFAAFYDGEGAEFFIICRALQELDIQTGLRDFLYSHYPVLAEGSRYLVFDLREGVTE